MPHRRLPNSNATRDTALTVCKNKMGAVPVVAVPFAPAKGLQLTTQQPAYHALIATSNLAKFNQTLQSAVVAPLRYTARLWVSHGFQALINACIRGQFDKQVKNLYGMAIDAIKIPNLDAEAAIEQAAITYNDGEAARIAVGGDPITFPDLADINTHVDALNAANLIQSAYKMTYDEAQESLAASNPAVDLLVLQLWNSIEATYDTGNKPSLRRKAREWGVVYVPNPGEIPSGDDYSVIGKMTDAVSGLPLSEVELILTNGPLGVDYTTDADGMYYLQVVSSGSYNLTATLAGYEPFATVVEVIEGDVLELNISLTPIAPPAPPAG